MIRPRAPSTSNQAGCAGSPATRTATSSNSTILSPASIETERTAELSRETALAAVQRELPADATQAEVEAVMDRVRAELGSLGFEQRRPRFLCPRRR